MTPAVLAKLKTGKKVNVVARASPDDVTIVMEGVPIALLAHYSEYAKKNCGNDRLVVDGDRNNLRWVCQYMAAGEQDGNLSIKLNHFSVSGLCELYKLAQFLEYPSLIFRIDSILNCRIRNGVVNKDGVAKIYQFLPHLSKSVIAHVVQLMLVPRAMDYEPYSDLASENTAFGQDLDDAIQQNLKHKAAHITEAKARAPVCYHCKVAGHMARECPQRKKGNYHYRKSHVIQVATNGEGLRTCDRVVRKGEMTRTGLII
ncbi:hypothetical protein DM02DRAFT_652048 [Periconia macrospinosa]|uniref:CCHC-type domain-containing protein n=1 Tax=Periconia macrospinosa TaxID=97972 RepID=A0A2V1E0V3_9PLEO|nr:hypothetical protein DM02DRAFT_652048 [Periconia macrospinosa]